MHMWKWPCMLRIGMTNCIGLNWRCLLNILLAFFLKSFSKWNKEQKSHHSWYGECRHRICFSFSLLRRDPWSMWSYSRHIIHKWELGGCHVLSGLLTACDTFFLAILWRINPLWLHTTTRSLKFGYYHQISTDHMGILLCKNVTLPIQQKKVLAFLLPRLVRSRLYASLSP